jgi:integrase
MKATGYSITRDKFLSEADMRKLLKTCEEKAALDALKGRRTWVTRYMLVRLAVFSGLRVSEIASLKVCDLHLNQDSYLVVRKGKGGRKRDVYIDRELARLLNKYLDHKKKAFGESVAAEAPLFAGRAGKHFTTTALEISWYRAVETAGIKSCGIHSARHTYATNLLAKTNNLRYVQKQLGHSSLSMTSLYADILPEHNGQLANAILG